MKGWLVIICGIVFLSGCAKWAKVRTDFVPLDTSAISSKPSSEVTLITGDLDSPYREIGIILVRGRHRNYEKVTEGMRPRDLNA
jgi:hypothetical protein